MKGILCLCFTVLMFPLSSQHIYNRTLKLMGSRFDITVVASDSLSAIGYIDLAVQEITRIEDLISEWNPQTQTSKINQQAGVSPVKVDYELFSLIERSQVISKLTDGAFDITFAAADKIWRFDGSMKSLPTPEEVTKSVAKIGYQKIQLNKTDTSVYLPESGMKIGFGAIGKGYSADKAKALLMEHGVVAGIINASGDMNTWGQQPDGQPWQVAITNPLNKDHAFAMVPIINNAVVTSGDYEKYVLIEGKRYAHIINPKTGYPAQGIISSTVFAPNAELADAMATALVVMGMDVAIERVNQIPYLGCILIDEGGNIHTSRNINIKDYEK